jgi:uncharacterized glyoxalase superfamily protein PhnB
MSDPAVVNQINLVVRDTDATVGFYRTLRVTIDAPPGAQHVAVRLEGGLLLEFDTTDFAGQWDAGWRGSTGGSIVLGCSVGSREAVDQAYESLTAVGYVGHPRPYDAFWGARYAIVDDPEANPVGITSSVDENRKTWSPEPPPVPE